MLLIFLLQSDISEMPWFALSNTARDIKSELIKKYGIDSIPNLVLLDFDGNMITRKGLDRVCTDPLGKSFPWRGEKRRDSRDRKPLFKSYFQQAIT
jgi:hypothetical protein